MLRFKNIILGFTSLFVLTASLSFAQEVEENSIRVSIKTGNAHGLYTLLDKTVELKTEEENGSYSNTQAEFILKNYFRKYPPTSFEYNHKGSSPNGAKYMIGTYTSGENIFRVYVKLKKINGKY